MNTGGWFTTWTFWVGALWGASVCAIALWHWLIQPMGRLLGFVAQRDANSHPVTRP